ncbi:MAG: glycosyltransferase [Dermatophilaceae bacterium]
MDTLKRLRILIVSHMYPQDETDIAGIFVKEQAEAMCALADVTVAVGRYGGQRTTTPGTPNVEEVPLPLRCGLPSAVRVVTATGPYFREVLGVAAETGPYDIVHAHYGVPDGVAGVRLGAQLGVPTIVTLHGSDFNRQFAFPVIGPALARKVVRADRIVGVSAAISDGMRLAYPDAAGRILHLANGYNSSEIHVHANRTPRHLLFVGSLTPRKNPDVLLDAFAQITDETSLDLVIVGGGPLETMLADRARALGIADRVHIEGSRAHSELDAYLAQAAALVLPSSSEGMPIVVNEALASGTPVVASRLPGIEQQVRSEEWGTLVPPGDVDALVAALRDTLRRDWDYAEIAATCGVPSWNEYARSLVRLYRNLTD